MRLPLLLVSAFVLGAAAGFGAALWQMRRVPVNEAPGAPRRVDMGVVDGGIYRVRKAVDGDTLVLDSGLHIRYLGVNTPEMKRFVRDPDPMAEEAMARNLGLVEGRRVRLRLAREPMDDYGRVVADVFLVPDDPGAEEVHVNALLLREGLARAMGMGLESAEYQALKKLQDEAKAAKVGLWGLPDRLRAAGVSKPYIATNTGDVFHLSTCNSGKLIPAFNRHEYATREEAEATGRRPCKRCIPE